MTHFVVTTTWNSGDLVAAFLDHYRRLGLDGAIVMDFASTDGTHDILASSEWRSFVELVPFPGIAALDSSNLMLALAAGRPRDQCWCLFCDPDELLVTPSMTVRDLGQREIDDRIEAFVIRRFNVTAPLSVAESADQRLTPLDALTLRIAQRHVRVDSEMSGKEALQPPWIFTDIPGKVLVKVDTAIAVGEGDHTVRTSHDRSADGPDGVYLLHYPFRSFAAFQAKVELARIGFEANPHLSEGHGWQHRRWLRLADADRLRTEVPGSIHPRRRRGASGRLRNAGIR